MEGKTSTLKRDGNGSNSWHAVLTHAQDEADEITNKQLRSSGGTLSPIGKSAVKWLVP